MPRSKLSSREARILVLAEGLVADLELVQTAILPERSVQELGSIAASWSLPEGHDPKANLCASAQASLAIAKTVRDWSQSTSAGLAPATAWTFRDTQVGAFVGSALEVAAKLRTLGSPVTETLALADSIQHGIDQFVRLERRTGVSTKSARPEELPEDITLSDVREVIGRLDRGFRESVHLFGELRNLLAEHGNEPQSAELDGITVGAGMMDDRAYHACIEYVDRIRHIGELRGSYNSAFVELLAVRAGQRSELDLKDVVRALNHIRRRTNEAHVIRESWQIGQELYLAAFVAGFFLGDDDSEELLIRRCRTRGLYLCRFGQMLEELYDPGI